MTTYYLFQHLLLSLGLALCAVGMPKFFHLAALPRALLAASLTPQVIGLLVMVLAQSNVNAPALYMHAPIVFAAMLLVIAAARLSVHGQRCLSRTRITPAGIAVTLIGAVLAVQLGLILLDNAQTLNVLSHDFNVYMSAAKAFAASPGAESMPNFYGGLGDVIVVHPHSFIYESYLTHALMLGGADLFFPPLDFLPRFAQQLTMVYLLIAIAGVTVSMGERWAVVAALCLALYIPWVYYIPEAMSRDGFRMAPLFGFIVVLSSLGLNFSSALVKRGLLAGAYAALVIMSHTLGLMLSVIIGCCVLAYVVARRRPVWGSLGAYLIPLALVGGLSIVRYVHNYLDTGGFMGYGLQYTIYKGTWLEPLIGKSWTEQGQDWLTILNALLHRYNWYLQVMALGVSFLAVLFTRGRGRVTYLILLVGLWAPLMVAVSGALDYAGINLRNALMTNGRYALSFFLLSAPLLVVGIARIGARLARSLQLRSEWRQLAVVTVTCFAALLAHASMRTPSWRSVPSYVEDINQIKLLHQATGCLKPDQHWFVDSDRWNVYFMERPPVFAFTLPARPLLMAPDLPAMEAMFQSMDIKLAVFIESSTGWHHSPLYSFLKVHWTLIPMSNGYRVRELWVAPDIAECIEKSSVKHQ